MNNDNRKKLRKSTILVILALVSLGIAAACSALSPGGDEVSKEKTISVKDIPEYGSENQDSAGGWVYLDAVKIERMGTATTQTKYRGSTTNTSRRAIYVIWDKDDKQLVLTRGEDAAESLQSLLGSSDPDELMQMPQRFYGLIIGTARQIFSGYKGVEGTLFGHLDDDVISYHKSDEQWLASEVKINIVDKEKSRKRDIYDGINIAAILLAIVLFVISRKVKKNEEIELLQRKISDS